ncbi:MAG TPA: N-formylglutamate amidohydrolase [Phycisphaerae bacterium]|nr:N-formylglutamate amidohydrolase [Phycisphaerae bacterium]HRW54541.1 N-formylglutamate amidohydrolase [Phycisphaerae bacterium]
MPRAWGVVVSCEHAGNRTPRAFASLFQGAAARRALASHRGWDPGSLTLGRRIADAVDAPIVVHEITRLLIEVNRSPWHPSLFSEFSKSLSRADRRALITSVYETHRSRVEAAVREAVESNGTALHIGAHTFTPQMNGVLRNADVGLLYDPRRRAEASFCRRWRDAIRSLDPAIRVRLNYPYRGAADGLTTAFRRRFGTTEYLGIELEVNQRFVGAGKRRAFNMLIAVLTASLRTTLDARPSRRRGRRAPTR